MKIICNSFKNIDQAGLASPLKKITNAATILNLLSFVLYVVQGTN